jgi:sialate O-acetylesterase
VRVKTTLFDFDRYLLAVLLLCASPLFANVSLPVVLSDGVVLQREQPIHVWGRAAPGESVRVALNKQSKSTVADFTGRWHIYLAPEAAGGPYELRVQGTNEIVLHDVLVGDVWVASGQSNMEFPMEGWGETPKDAAEEIAKANLPTVHLLHIAHAYADHPLDDFAAAQWVACTPESVRKFSAVGYYFAKEVNAREKVPVGVIETSWGGTVAEAWVSLDGLSQNPGLMPIFANRAHMMDSQIDSDLIAPHQEELKKKAKAEGKPEPLFAWHPEPQSWDPAALYNAMIAPLTPFAIRGVIWYQGESNSALERAPHYETLFQTLIRDWRNHWAIGDFPFLYVQIANFKSNALEDWATVRDAQRKALALRNTAMAVTIDIGNPYDVHPSNKREVGQRLALGARVLSYGDNVEYSGPLFREATREDHALRIWFNHADGLKAGAHGLCGFEVAGDDGHFVAATARIEGTTILLSSPQVEAPVSARYAWENNPECPMFNRAGLPASPFKASLALFH